MLQSNMLEKNKRQLQIPENAQVVEELLHYLYTDQVTANLDSVAYDLLPLAHMYDMQGLVDHCEKSLLDSVLVRGQKTASLAIRLLALHGKRHTDLTEYIQTHLYEVSREKEWSHLRGEKVKSYN